jgi:hypothetical protein
VAALPPGDRAHAVPTVEATTTVGWVRPRAVRRQRLCGHGGARRGGAGTEAVERKTDGRRGGEEGVREAQRSAVVVA